MHTERVDDNTDPSTVCRTRDGKEIAGVQLVAGKLCQCPDDTPYFNPNTQTCQTAEQVYAEGNMLANIAF